MISTDYMPLKVCYVLDSNDDRERVKPGESREMSIKNKSGFKSDRSKITICSAKISQLAP